MFGGLQGSRSRDEEPNGDFKRPGISELLGHIYDSIAFQHNGKSGTFEKTVESQGPRVPCLESVYNERLC